MNNENLVSVIITTCDRPVFFERALCSVLNQSYRHLEIIVIDDGSESSCGKIVSDKKDSRIIYKKTAGRQGACFSRNLGINLASGFYCTGLDDDDEFALNRINILVDSFNPKYSFVTGNTTCFSEEKEYLLFKDRNVVVNKRNFLWGNSVGSQVLTLTSRLKSIHGFDEKLSSAQDADTWLRLIEKYGPGLRVKGSLYYLYVGDMHSRISTSSKKADGLIYYFQKHSHAMTLSQKLLLKYKIKKYSSSSNIKLLPYLLFTLSPTFWLSKITLF